MNVCSDDVIVTCPYNKEHRIFRSRLQYHIVKCEKNFPEDYKVLCPYDAIHRLNKNELMDHILVCPKKTLIDSNSSQKKQNRTLIKSRLELELLNITDNDETWDDDEEFNPVPFTTNHVSEIKPKVYRLNEGYLRAPRGYSEAMLSETDENVKVEDVESVVSSMGIGRGIINQNNIHLLAALGRGRGFPLS